MLPIVAAWASAGSPSIERTPSITTRCALCGDVGMCHPFNEVISTNFTAWERLPFQRDSLGFCPGAAWGFRCKALRLRIHQLTPVFRQLEPSELRELLASALSPDVTIAVPIGRHKHVAPWATHGSIETDNETVTWSSDDADRLAVVAHLRDLGFGEMAQTEDQPRWALLKKLDHDERTEAVTFWPLVDPWRKHPVMLDIALRATRKDTDGPPNDA